ncbi:MAG: hypothetical protein IT426_03125 [Pirellulales bacterium]|nr:hypothetical protein [Pirellulales bacterium]
MKRSKVESGEWRVEGREGGRRKAEGGKAAARCFGIHPSYFILHPSPVHSPLSPLPSPLIRRGVSLLEVLISIGVLTVGLLGVLAIIPLGQMTIAESVKAERAGACGRAAMRDIKVKRLLDYRSWMWEQNTWGIGYDPSFPPASQIFPIRDPDVPDAAHPLGVIVNNAMNPPLEAFGSFMIDPEGRAQGLPSILYGVTINNIPYIFPRRSLSADRLNPTTTRTMIPAGAFYWPDDLAFETPENPVERPGIGPAVGLLNSRSLDYSYLFTAAPSSSERWLAIPKRRFFDVTVVVFFKRNFNLTLSANAAQAGFPEGEWVADVNSISNMPAGAVSPGGGTIALGNASMTNYAYRVKGSSTGQQTLPLPNPLPFVREGQWVMLWDSADGRLAWYRVIGVNFPDAPTAANSATLTLDGPDWTVSQNQTEKLIVIDGAIGAYTSTVELDYDPLWQGLN